MRVDIVNKLEIKGVRINIDHLEYVIRLFESEELEVTIYSKGIDDRFEPFNDLNHFIKSKGITPKIIVVEGNDLNRKISVLINLQYCIIESYGINSIMIHSIANLMRGSRPFLFKLFSFKWFSIITLLTFLFAVIIFFVGNKNYSFLLFYAGTPVIVFCFAGIYNNYISGIHLIRKHQKSNIWKRKKDDILITILSVLLLTPIATALWEFVLKEWIMNLLK